MTFRITPAVLFEHARFDLTSSYARFARAQSQISTGKRVRRFSDDPAAASRALDLKVALARAVQQRESVSAARFAADTQAAILEEVSGLLIDARAAAQDAASGTNSPSDLKVMAAELNSILEQVVGRANQQFEGRYLFAGSMVETVPFPASKTLGSITAVSYAGDDITRKVRLGPADIKDVDLSGKQAFLAFRRTASVIASPIGLAVAKGAADTMIGSAKIVVEHTATVIGDGLGAGGGDAASGVAPGASTLQDTLIGPAGVHVLNLVSDATGGGTVSLDDGSTVQFTGAETDLALTSVSGAVIHLDLTSVTPGFTGSVDLAGDGEISVAGGPAQALSFSADFALQDGAGRVVHLDTTNVQQEGASLVVFPGTETVFDTLIALRDDLLGAAGFPPEDLVQRIQTRLVALDRGHEGVLAGLSELGARSASFDRISSGLVLFEISLEEKRGELEDTDIFTASLELSQAENAYQAALMASARLNGPSLLDFL
ncbi:MAG: flagellar hook-associated protein FlgL [Planctomycetes bacterium]|nr:flagellar hook-associated protein FlgL [Planctomycetota bacterium]